ncbi:MFS transporter [Candidatus Shapirobacteria bacterium]|nr:MFS transporter [Candidatus Shapirobacteria bacterium]
MIRKDSQNHFSQLLGNKDFLKIWICQGFSTTTINLVSFALIMKIFETTLSTITVSFVFIFLAIPAILIGPFSGVVIDMVDRRKALVFTSLAEAAIVFCFSLVGAKIWPVYGLILLFSSLQQFYVPAEGASLTTVVEKKNLPAANSLFLFTVYGGLLAGAGSASLLLRVFGRRVPFVIGSLFLLIAALASYLLPREKFMTPPRIRGWEKFFQELYAGYRFISQQQLVLFPILLLVFIQMTLSILAILFPSFAVQVLKIEVIDAGTFLILPAAIGAILGAVLATRLLGKLRKKRVICAGLFGFSGCLLSLSLVLPLLSDFRVPLAFTLMFFAGTAFVAVIIPTQTLIQQHTPSTLRGRVFGVLGFLGMVVSLIPTFLTAALAEVIGETWVIFLISLIILGLGIYGSRGRYALSANANHKL